MGRLTRRPERTALIQDFLSERTLARRDHPWYGIGNDGLLPNDRDV
jgi:hypothetical protein